MDSVEEENLAKTDEILVFESLADKNVFGEIINRYEDKLLRYISRRARLSADDKKDILQNIFIKTYLNLNNFDRDLKFSSWIYRIAHNEVIDWYRKSRIRPSLSLDDENLKILETLAGETDIETSAETAALAEAAKAALENLPEKYREVLILRFFEEKDYAEISDILAAPAGTVATRISRAKKELKKSLSKFM